MNVDSGTLSLSVVVQRISMGVAGAVVIGGGSMILADNTRLSVDSSRITNVEQALVKVPEIDRNIIELKGQLNVLNQKLDDARDARVERQIVNATPKK